MEFFSWYALFPQCYVMFLRDFGLCLLIEAAAASSASVSSQSRWSVLSTAFQLSMLLPAVEL